MANTNAPLSGAVRMHLGKPTLFVNDDPVYPMFYSLTDCPGGRWSFEEMPQTSLRHFAQQGVRLFQVDLFFEQMFSEDGRFDVAVAQRQLRGVLDACPTAAVVIRLHVNSLRSWNRAHPEECCRYADLEADPTEPFGLKRIIEWDNNHPLRHSMASKRWRDESTRMLQTFCREFSKTPEAGHLIGLHVAGGIYGEWHYWGFMENEPDTSTPMTAAFRNWLRGKYENDRALQEAWQDDAVTLDAATVPGTERRNQTKDGIFLDPRSQRRVIDYFECHHAVLADAMLHFCRVAKESWPRPLVIGVFYGYFFSCFGRQATGGHLQVERVLNSPYVDYLSAPMSYWGSAHGFGGSGHSRGVLGSAFRHGKLWLDEMDQNTHLHTDKEFKTSDSTLEDDVARVRRNVAQSYTRGMGLWFYDFGPRTMSGWWSHPVLLEDIRRQREIYDGYSKRPFRREADVLVVYDAAVFHHTANSYKLDPIQVQAMEEMTADLYHSGVVFDDAYLFDLDQVDLGQYKVVIFANTFLLDESKRRAIKDRAVKDGRHVIFNYMPGYADGQRLDVRFVQDVTGIKLEKFTPTTKPEMMVEHEDYPKVRWAPWSAVPLLAVADDQATTIGRFAEGGQVALARKPVVGGTAWFSSIPLRTPELMRRIFREAGAHIYTDSGDTFYAGGGVVCLHTVEGGPREVALRNGRQVRLELSPRSTMLLDAETGQALL